MKLLYLLIPCLFLSPMVHGSDAEQKNDLEQYFEANPGRMIHKWMHYFEAYHKHFTRYRGNHVKVLEIGVSHGGSLQMWKNYFGDKAEIIGVDINERCKALEEDQITIYIGDQQDRNFLRYLKELIGQVDIVIDDGGHFMDQQITAFEELYPIVASNGIYLVEDLHTSYWPNYGGGYKKKGSFIEYTKKLIDQLNAWHSKDPSALCVDDFTKSTKSMHFYDSMIVFEKGTIPPPSHRMTGFPSF